MANTSSDTVIMKTPAGHEVLAELDYTHFSVQGAKVVHRQTGVMTPLDQQITDNIARALHAKQIYETALEESRAVEAKLSGFGEAIVKLGYDHPALKPYWREADQHRHIARDMGDQARRFYEDAMAEIDRMIEGKKAAN